MLGGALLGMFALATITGFNKNKVTDMIDYSSGSIEKYSKEEMKSIIQKAGLLN